MGAEPRNRPRLSSRLFCLWLLAAVLACAVRSSAAAQEKIRLGVSLPLTGPAATYGIDTRNAIVFAAARFAPGRYEFIFEDDKCSPKEAVGAAHKLIEVERVKYVLGFACSGAILASAPLYERAGVLAMAALASSPAVSKAGDYIFRMRPDENSFMRVFGQLLSRRHQSLAIVAEQTEYAQTTRSELKRFIDHARVSLHEEDYLPEISDFRSLLMRLKAGNPQAIVIIAQTEQSAAAMVRQIREIGLKSALYGSNAVISASFPRLAGAAAEGVSAISMPSLETALNQEGKDLLAAFESRYGRLAGVDYAFYLGVEAFRAMHAAITSGQDPREYLYSHSFNGIFGSYSFDGNGDIVSSLAPQEQVVKNGRLVPLEDFH